MANKKKKQNKKEVGSLITSAEEFLKSIDQYKLYQQKAGHCPNCGYCPTCGRGNSWGNGSGGTGTYPNPPMYFNGGTFGTSGTAGY